MMLKNKNWFIKIRYGQNCGVFDKTFCPGQERDFIESVESLMSTGKIFKNDKSTTVVKTHFAGKDIVIKRYNYQSLLHAVRHTIKGSRAQKVWKYTKYLIDAGISTPSALCYINTYKHGFYRTSYIIHEFVNAENLVHFISHKLLDDNASNRLFTFCDKLKKSFKRHKISHNDLKPANILINDRQIYLIDLDGMCMHRFHFHFVHRHNKDLEYIRNRILPDNPPNKN